MDLSAPLRRYPSPPPFRDARILLVGADAVMEQQLRDLLASREMRCQAQPTLAAAQGALCSGQPTLLIVSLTPDCLAEQRQVIRAIRHNPRVAVMALAAGHDPALVRAARRIGAMAYLVYPFTPDELLFVVQNLQHHHRAFLRNLDSERRLKTEVLRRTRELMDTIEQLEAAREELLLSHEETLGALTRATSFRDDDTGQHLWRISLYTELLARRAGLAKDCVNDLRLGSTMHDLGKVGIPDHILLKQGRLTPAEYRVMQRHAEIGYRILNRSRSAMLRKAAEIAHTHHEWFDGSGYPKRLAGNEIPLAGRIVAIGDVFDALTTARPYKPAMAPELARAYMEDLRGRQFDPALLDLFMEAWPRVRAIHEAQGGAPLAASAGEPLS